MALPPDPEAVFVDVDNTLYPFEEDLTHTVEAVHGEHQEAIDLPREGFVDAYWSTVAGFDDDDIWAMIREDPHGFRRRIFEELVASLDGSVDVEPGTLLETFEARRFEAIQAYPGALETVEELAERTTVGIITNGPPAFQRPKIRGLGVDELVPEELTFVSGEVGIHKPDRGIFERAGEAAGLSSDEAVMIGDGLEYDVPAKALGWGAVWFNAVGHDADPDAAPHPPDAVATDWTDVRELLLD